MLYATTAFIQGREVEAYLGVVFGDAVLGINIFKDLMASVRDVVGGRSGTYERELASARDTAMRALTSEALALGADAILGIDLDYEVLGSKSGMLMVSASGTAVRLKPTGAAGPWTRPGA